jgi:hypothetical protein
MSTVDTEPNTNLLYHTIAAFMALVVVGTVARIVYQVFSGPAIEPIGLGIAVLSMMVLCLMVVSAAPSRHQPCRRFNTIVGAALVCNIGSHLVWFATLTIGTSA